MSTLPPARDPSALGSEDIREYVEALRASADRSRVALYVALIATTLVFIANYNIQPREPVHSRRDSNPRLPA